ncbi:MAG: phage holin family protein [Phycisphaerales bacterium]|nr:phage holin family protein [Phycisphaerales bacterium]
MVAAQAEETKERGGWRRMIASSSRLVDVHYRITVLRAKMAVVRVGVFVGLAVGAVGLGLLGIVFLYVGVFRLLTDVAGLPVWGAFLIYAGGHVVTALAMLIGGMRMMRGRGRT